jgi:hypothetical protein
MESMDMIALNDEQLEAVAGGCGWRRRHASRHSGGGGGGGGGRRDVDVNIQINIIRIEDSVLQAGDDITVAASNS